MLTENRREYLKTRSTLDRGKKTEYDYRVLKWLEAMLDSGEKGGIGDINRVLDTLDRDTVRKHLKDENVDDLLKLVERLLDVMDFMPIGFTEKEVEYQGQKIKTKSRYVEKSIMVAPRGGGGEVSVLASYRVANNEDIKRVQMLREHVDQIKHFIETGTYMPDTRSAEYFKVQIDSAHKQGLIALAYDIRQPTKEEALLNAIDTAAQLGHIGPASGMSGPTEAQIAELREKVAKQKSENREGDEMRRQAGIIGMHIPEKSENGVPPK